MPTDEGPLIRVWRWVRDGPPKDGGTLVWIIGALCWWRLWGVGALLTTGFIAASWLLTTANPELAVVGAYAIGWVLSPLALKISGKYEVTRNY